MKKKRVDIFGAFVDDIDIEAALELSEKAIASGEKTSVFTPNLEFVSAARKNTDLKNLINSASISLPDGFSLRILSALLGESMENTVAGIDYGEKLLRLCEKGGWGVYFLGGKEGVAQRAAYEMKKKMPRLKICGAHHGYFGERERENVVSRINETDARVLFVCLGFPRQERFTLENAEALRGVTLIACLGGSLDVWSGETRRAPLLIRRIHLEWLWRVLLDPKRAKRLACSVASLIEALKIFCHADQKGGIKRDARAYNLTDICS